MTMAYRTDADPILRFGVCADIQYADKDDPCSEPPKEHKETYGFREALPKFEECVRSWNEDEGLSFTIQLGDIIDGFKESIDLSVKDLDRVIKVHDTLIPTRPNYHVLGNHCLNVGRSRLVPALKFPTEGNGSSDEFSAYYDFVLSNWRFIVLDSCDVGVADPERGAQKHPKHQKGVEWMEKLALDDAPNRKAWNGALDEEQVAWLKDRLSLAEKEGQKVIIFKHIPLIAEAATDKHLMWNKEEILELIKDSPVVAVVCGHCHIGGYAFHEGIHHITLEAIVEAKDSNAYGTVDLYENYLEIRGTGTLTR
eukprot:TRINITY_DN1444_c0_g1_i2.p1 TRINITY_DN1444_c0_g1~~TRINITY_DN1444_c0_g1_i2.p1  ORF type:complete len:310 (-),score=43.03 TRINITY_DN1444_c0_g1_i2:100-1029(-)